MLWTLYRTKSSSHFTSVPSVSTHLAPRILKIDVIYTLSIIEAIQDKQQADYKSFFQVAGIHGLPFTEWAKKQPNLRANKSGYCTHGSVIFPTWHRTYVSIYEVRLFWLTRSYSY